MLSNLSLRYKIPLRISILILIVVVAVTVSLLARSSLIFKQDLSLSSENMGRIMANTLTGALLYDDVWKAYEIINAPFSVDSKNGSLQADTVIVLDKYERVYVSTAPRQYPILTDPALKDDEIASLKQKLSQHDPMSPVTIEMPGLGNIYVVTPIDSDGVLLGRLVMLYSHEIYIDRFLSFMRQAAMTAVLIIVFLLPFGVYWGRRTAAPLMELSKCMGQVGTSITEIPDCRILKGGDEIGQLGTQFEHMIEQLREKEALEKQMVVSDRLAAIGRFTAGIAHEINNPLGGLLNATNTLQRHGAQDPLTRKTVSLLERGLLQIKETVAALLVEAKHGAHAVTHQDIEDTRTLVMPAAQKKSARLHWVNGIHQPANLPSTYVRQILINLLLNSIDAVPDNGRISCEVSTTDGVLRIATHNEGEQIRNNDLEHLFEPFVSGRESGRGLGLWVTYQIVNTLNGSIEVSSGEDDTEFVVTLPLRQAA
ncbi:MAG: HAMP domain-containing histidine kinase [Gammaproteobacteria bacterium]|nr:HAMP domain-containing histidine kinase [Gammaproteobacteria bacterium]MDH3379564.1 HAMP domain-containing histidine kinase [Gammaproteobacteria bacterium]